MSPPTEPQGPSPLERALRTLDNVKATYEEDDPVPHDLAVAYAQALATLAVAEAVGDLGRALKGIELAIGPWPDQGKQEEGLVKPGPKREPR